MTFGIFLAIALLACSLGAHAGECERADPSASAERTRAIVFVHGLGGDARGTWTSLPSVIGRDEDVDAVAYLFGYPTTPLGGGWGIEDARTKLAKCLGELRSYDEVIVVAHSMGGLVAARALLGSPEDAARTSLLLLLGTPQWGSPVAEIAKAFKNPALTNLLPGNQNAYLQQLESNWRVARRTRAMPVVVCLYETQPLTRLWSSTIVVPADSATRWCDDSSPVEVDHLGLVKPERRPLSALRGAIREWAPTFRLALSRIQQGDPGAVRALCEKRELGLLSWWSGNGDTRDACNRHHGTRLSDLGYSPEPAHGKRQGFYFKRAGAVAIGDDRSFSGLTKFTIVAWIQPQRTSEGVIISKYDSRTLRPPNKPSTTPGGFSFEIENGRLRLFVSERLEPLKCFAARSSQTIPNNDDYIPVAVTWVAPATVNFLVGSNFQPGVKEEGGCKADLQHTGDDPEVFVLIGSYQSVSGSAQFRGGQFYGSIRDVLLFARGLSEEDVRKATRAQQR
jgi:pimeloyl-ACP methyl ester carboxylesterase